MDTSAIPKVTQEEVDKVKQLLRQAGIEPKSATRGQISALAGISDRRARTIRNWLQWRDSNVEYTTPVPIAPTGKPTETDEIDGDERVFTKVVHDRIKTLDDLIRVCEIDTSEWEIYRWVANKWEVGAKDAAKELQIKPLYQVKAWMRLKKEVVSAKAEIDALRQKAEEYSPGPYIISPRSSQTGNMAEYSIYDHHFGAHIWGKETGWEDYDLRTAKSEYEPALATLVNRMRPYGADTALITFGNDQQNADNRSGTTERGTRQDMDTRYQKVFGVSRDVSIWAVECLLSEYSKVKVVIVPGNHDPLASWHLGDSLRCWFRNFDSVTVDNEPTARKYIQHGNVMLMFTHGNTGKLEKYGQTMAAEQPKMWGDTKWREAHTGDKHHREVIEVPGAIIRILPSLRPPCAWSSDSHYIGAIRAAEAFCWNDREGLIGTATYSILRKDDAA